MCVHRLKDIFVHFDFVFFAESFPKEVFAMALVICYNLCTYILPILWAFFEFYPHNPNIREAVYRLWF